METKSGVPLKPNIKTNGFNIEDTHITHIDRLEKLMLIVMIAFVWCYKIGDFIDREIKAIVVKKHGEELYLYLNMD